MNQMQDDFNDRVTTISLATYPKPIPKLHVTRASFPLLVHVDRWLPEGVNTTCNLPFDHFDTFSIHPITSSPSHHVPLLYVSILVGSLLLFSKWHRKSKEGAFYLPVHYHLVLTSNRTLYLTMQSILETSNSRHPDDRTMVPGPPTQRPLHLPPLATTIPTHRRQDPHGCPPSPCL
jgi:hypothetical protein